MQSLGELQELCSYASKKPASFLPKPEHTTEPKQPYKCPLAAENFWEIIQFFTFDECAKTASVNSTFSRFIQPRLEMKMQLLSEQIQETKRKLDETNKEIEQRREQIAELNGHIGTMTGRLTDMGVRLQTMNEQIVASHDRIDALMIRVRALK
uniref:Uncharacterized protein n=1 Tax=Ditylenchus dipsaci TaxID=166011 RepID=A0A915EJU4_9BILA